MKFRLLAPCVIGLAVASRSESEPESVKEIEAGDDSKKLVIGQSLDALDVDTVAIYFGGPFAVVPDKEKVSLGLSVGCVLSDEALSDKQIKELIEVAATPVTGKARGTLISHSYKNTHQQNLAPGHSYKAYCAVLREGLFSNFHSNVAIADVVTGKLEADFESGTSTGTSISVIQTFATVRAGDHQVPPNKEFPIKCTAYGGLVKGRNPHLTLEAGSTKLAYHGRTSHYRGKQGLHWLKDCDDNKIIPNTRYQVFCASFDQQLERQLTPTKEMSAKTPPGELSIVEQRQGINTLHFLMDPQGWWEKLQLDDTEVGCLAARLSGTDSSSDELPFPEDEFYGKVEESKKQRAFIRHRSLEKTVDGANISLNTRYAVYCGAWVASAQGLRFMGWGRQDMQTAGRVTLKVALHARPHWIDGRFYYLGFGLIALELQGDEASSLAGRELKRAIGEDTPLDVRCAIWPSSMPETALFAKYKKHPALAGEGWKLRGGSRDSWISYDATENRIRWDTAYTLHCALLDRGTILTNSSVSATTPPDPNPPKSTTETAPSTTTSVDNHNGPESREDDADTDADDSDGFCDQKNLWSNDAGQACTDVQDPTCGAPCHLIPARTWTRFVCTARDEVDDDDELAEILLEENCAVCSASHIQQACSNSGKLESDALKACDGFKNPCVTGEELPSWSEAKRWHATYKGKPVVISVSRPGGAASKEAAVLKELSSGIFRSKHPWAAALVVPMLKLKKASMHKLVLDWTGDSLGELLGGGSQTRSVGAYRDFGRAITLWMNVVEAARTILANSWQHCDLNPYNIVVGADSQVRITGWYNANRMSESCGDGRSDLGLLAASFIGLFCDESVKMEPRGDLQSLLRHSCEIIDEKLDLSKMGELLLPLVRGEHDIFEVRRNLHTLRDLARKMQAEYVDKLDDY